MKCSEVLFDSDKENWNENVFAMRLFIRSQLIFVIEDEEDQKFGGYLNSKIDKVFSYNDEGYRCGDGTIKDENAFVFSLQSNGRLNEMMKFEIKD